MERELGLDEFAEENRCGVISKTNIQDRGEMQYNLELGKYGRTPRPRPMAARPRGHMAASQSQAAASGLSLRSRDDGKTWSRLGKVTNPRPHTASKGKGEHGEKEKYLSKEAKLL